MSKVKIEGNASGTGTLTIAAPNTNSDYSVTLPEVTGGEFVVTDSSGNVGIGTSSPDENLHIFNGSAGSVTANTASQLVIENSSDAGINLLSPNTQDNWLMFGDADDNFVGGLRYNHPSDYLSLYANNAERMRIDSAGRVTMPYQPYFAAEMNGNNSYVTMSTGAVFPYNNAPYNVGNHFNTSNYRFTAPVTGKYLFTASIITNTSPIGRLMFYVNNSTDTNGIKWGISGSGTSGQGDTNTSAIIFLNANDFVDVRSQSGSSVMYQSDHSSFTGMLLG
jgi:hypothetical protein